MRSLLASLNEHPMALLRGIAAVRGVALSTHVRADAAAQLAAVLAEPTATEAAVAECTAEARAAWEALCAVGGHIKVTVFTRTHGSIRPLGPGRMEREQPWQQPASAAEELWFHGLIFRAFANLGEGPMEYFYVPDELLTVCSAHTPEAGMANAPSRTVPQRSAEAQNALAIDACQLLAMLRGAPLRLDNAGQLRPADREHVLGMLLVHDPARLELLLTLMQQLEWVAADRGRLVVNTTVSSAWLRSGYWPQVTALYEAWRDSTDTVSSGPGWNDLRHVPDLRSEGGWRNDPLLARRALLGFLRELPTAPWHALDALVAAIKARHPDFQRPDGNFTGWYLRDAGTGQFLSGFESWDAVEGRLLRWMLTGPLFWLGAVALGTQADGTTDAFRITPVGLAWLTGGAFPDPPKPARLRLRDDLTVLAPPSLPLMDRFRLLRFTDPAPGVGESGRPTLHRITRDGLSRARAEGLKGQVLLKFLQHASGGDVPERLATGLERWDQHHGAVRVSRGAVLRVDDAATLALLRADPVVRNLLGELLSAQAVLVSEANLPRVLAALQELGYSVKVEQQDRMVEQTPDRIERLERLRRLGLRRGARDLPRTPPQPASETGILPGEVTLTPAGAAWVRAARYPLAEHPELAAFLDVTPAALAALGQDGRLNALQPAHAAFIDTETTGLSLGTDTYTFLIGVGQFEAPEPGAAPDAFVVRQFFMRSPDEEVAQLLLVEEAFGRAGGFISFNGRGFDMPLIVNRFTLARLPVRFTAWPHLDLLPAARRIWRLRLQSCRLGNLEQHVLGLLRTQEDVPGWMIPDIYRDYYRTGLPTDMLARVFYHNLQDILSMVLLGARLAALFQAERVDSALAGLHPLDALSLARCYEGLNWNEACIVAYRAAQAHVGDAPERAAVLRDLALLYKRLGRADEAATVWEDWLATVPGDDLTPYVELAKHHEWQTIDLAAARGWAAWALHIAQGWPAGPARSTAIAELQHRLARLERKLGTPGA